MVGMCPVNTYQTTDGYILIMALTNPQADNAMRAIGREDLIGTEKFKSAYNRWRNREEIDAMVEEWTKARTKEEAFKEISGKDVPCGIVFSAEEVLNDPDLANRGMIVEVDQPGIGKVKMMASPIRLSDSPRIMGPAPLLGEHNQEVYADLLGYAPEQLEKLKEEGVI